MISHCPVHRIAEAVKVGEEFFKFACESGNFSHDAACKYWFTHTINQSGILFVDIDDANIIQGFCGIIFYPEPWTGALVCSEVCYYTKGKGGIELLKEAENAAKICGAKVLYMQHLSHNDRVAKLYKRRGFSYKYSRFVKEL